MPAFFVTVLAAAITLGGGLLALRTEAYRAVVYAFCAGALIGTALLGLIPEAMELSAEGGHEPLSALMATALGFFLFYVLENLPHRHTPADEVLHHRHGHATGLWGAAGLALHSFIDGVAIGEGFASSTGLGLTLSFGIIVHRFADGVSVTGMMRGTQQDSRTTVGMLILTAVAPIAGVLCEPLLQISALMRVLLLGWLAGLFLYLGTTSLLPAAHETGSSKWLPAYAITGLLVIYLAQTLVGHLH